MSRLRPCSSCARHVRVSERACPFCASALDPLLTPSTRAIARPSNRSAIIFFSAAATAATVAACTNSSEPGPSTFSSSSSSSGGGVPLYGGPPIDQRDAAQEGGDAGDASDAGDAGDANDAADAGGD